MAQLCWKLTGKFCLEIVINPSSSPHQVPALFMPFFLLSFVFQKQSLSLPLMFNVFCVSGAKGPWGHSTHFTSKPISHPARPLWSYSEFRVPTGLDTFKCKPTSATAGGLQSHPSCCLSQGLNSPGPFTQEGCPQIKRFPLGLCVETTQLNF
jgi:hypothetical protein